jgi:excisionase family DNA binding protein
MTPLMTVPEAAKLLAISRNTLYSHVAAGRIAYRRIGGSVRFSESDIENFVEASKVSVRPKYVPETKILRTPLKWIKRQADFSPETD